MIQLTQETVNQLPKVGDFRQRGMEMTRIEVFVDAAFAFAVTMLVISFDQIPSSYEEMVLALKGIPAFLVAVAQLVWIWYEHNIWSRRFGLDDVPTVLLSTTLVAVVLVYIYPLRVMAQGMFGWFTNGWLPSNFTLSSVDELRFMFMFMGLGFAALCFLFWGMYRWAMRRADRLLLSPQEIWTAGTISLIWLGFGVVGLVCVTLALLLSARWVPLSGFAFFLLGVWGPWLASRRGKHAPDQAAGRQ